MGTALLNPERRSKLLDSSGLRRSGFGTCQKWIRSDLTSQRLYHTPQMVIVQLVDLRQRVMSPMVASCFEDPLQETTSLCLKGSCAAAGSLSLAQHVVKTVFEIRAPKVQEKCTPSVILDQHLCVSGQNPAFYSASFDDADLCGILSSASSATQGEKSKL